MLQVWMESFLFLLELIHPANSKEHIRKNEYNNIAEAVSLDCSVIHIQ